MIPYVCDGSPRIYVSYWEEILRDYPKVHLVCLNICTREWVKTNKKIPIKLKNCIESWVDAHKKEIHFAWNHSESQTHLSPID